MAWRGPCKCRVFLFWGSVETGGVDASPITHIQGARRKSARWQVESRGAREEGRGREASAVVVAGGTQRARVRPRWNSKAHDMPQRTLAENNVGAKRAKSGRAWYRTSNEHSAATVGIRGRNETIRQKVIGRATPLEEAASAAGESSGTQRVRSRCSMSQRASMAAVFSSSH